MKQIVPIVALLIGTGHTTLAYATNDSVIAQPNVAVTSTESGKVQGFIHNNIFTYRGIPYAKAERFQAPHPVEKWQNTRTALNYGNICPQPNANPLENFMFSGNPATQSDDCLNLNVWTPNILDHKKRPVMVWIHGGGFSGGSAIENKSYDGENLSRTGDVVVVSINHRLNVMGHLDLSAYGSQYKNSANAGVMDMVSALGWVKANIDQFGGDPNNVTIFGESGGGAKVLTLMATPTAKGLFHKAIVESGAVEGMGMTLLSPKTTQRVSQLTLQNLGISADNLDKLKTLPYPQIAEASNKALDQTAKEQNIPSIMDNGIALSWAPSTDGQYIPTEPVGQKYPALAKNIPLLIGSNLTEWNTIYAHFNDLDKAQTDNKNNWTPEQVSAKIQAKYGSKSQAVTTAFNQAYPDRNPSDVLYVDSFLRTPALKTAQLKSYQQGANVYNYIFSWDTPMLGGFAMSYHTSEIPFVMNSLALTETQHGNSDEAKALADKMSRAWVAFAKSGNPNVAGLPNWQPYTRQSGATMIFDNQPVLKYHHDEKLMSLLNQKTQ